MEQKLIFKLDNPNFEKWELYKGLSASINKIDDEYGLITVNRTFCDSNYTCQVETKCSDQQTIFQCTHKVALLLAKHEISVTCLSAKQFSPPEFINISMVITLQEKFQTIRNFKKWEKLAIIIDNECTRRNIFTKRIKNPEKYQMTLFASFQDHFDWSYIGFFSGQIIGQAGLEMQLEKPILQVNQEDILDRITNLSGEHRQLSFDNILYMEKNGKRTKKSKAV